LCPATHTALIRLLSAAARHGHAVCVRMSRPAAADGNPSGLLSDRAGFFLLQGEVDDQKTDADADRSVRDIKGRPVIGINVEIQEVDHLSEAYPIQQVADRPA